MPRKREGDEIALDQTDDAEQEALADDDVLAQLSQYIVKAQTDKQRRNKHVEDAVAFLSRLSVKDYPELAENPVLVKFIEDVQAVKMKDPTIPPGTIMNKGTLAENKKPWTVQDLKSPPADWDGVSPLPPGHTQWHRFTPERNQTVVFDGIRVNLFRRREFYGPKIFYDLYVQSIDAEEAAEQHAAFMFRAEGAAPPSDPTILNEGTAAVRSTVTKGTYFPGMGTAGMAVPAAEGAGETAETAGAAS